MKSYTLGSRDENIKKIIEELIAVGMRGLTAGKGSGSKVYKLRSIGSKGRTVGYRPMVEDNMHNLAVVPTIKVAAMHNIGTGFTFGERFKIKREYFQEKIRKARTPVFLAITIETGGTEEKEVKSQIEKSLIKSILKDAYEKRHHVGLISFSGNKARTVLDFTTDLELANECVARLDFGGLTPLASGILTALTALHKKVGDRVSVIPILILFTSGLANVPLVPGGNIRRELINITRLISSRGVKFVVIDISERGNYLVKELALLGKGRYYHPPTLQYLYHSLGSKLLDSFEKRDIQKAVKLSKEFLRGIS